MMLNTGWHDVSEKPKPLKEGVICDKLIALTLYDSIEMMYYIYADDEWTAGGGDTQKVKAWFRIPEPYIVS